VFKNLAYQNVSSHTNKRQRQLSSSNAFRPSYDVAVRPRSVGVSFQSLPLVLGVYSSVSLIDDTRPTESLESKRDVSLRCYCTRSGAWHVWQIRTWSTSFRLYKHIFYQI